MEDYSRRPHPHHTQHQYSNSRQQMFPGPHMDRFFRPLGSPGFHHGPPQGPPHDFPSRTRPPQTGPGGGGPPSFPNWPNSFTSSLPSPHGLQPHPPSHPSPRMKFAPPPDERWAMCPPPFMGRNHGVGGLRFPPPPPPGPANFIPPDLSGLPMNSGQQQGGGDKFGAPQMQTNYRHHGGGVPDGSFSNPRRQVSKHEGGSYFEQLREVWQSTVGQEAGGNSRFPFQNGVETFQHNLLDGGGHNHSTYNQGGVKRMKTGTQGVPKRRAPSRPLVGVNKELRLKHSTHLSVVSYNLLAQDLIHQNMYLYPHCSPELLQWDFRKDNLLKDLVQSSADILCLQEVQCDHYHSWYQPQLTKHGYAGLFKKRTGSNSDGCAVFYREAKLKLVEWKGLEYQRRVRVLNRDNVAVLAKFAVMENGVDGDNPMFCVANTHLLFNPKAGEVKLAQITCLLAELHKIATKPGSGDLLPVMICGDFNSTPNSHLLKFMLTSHLDYSKLSALVIAGYYEEGGAKFRTIPVPLLPSSVGIDHNSTYRQRETNDVAPNGKDTEGKDTGGNTNTGSIVGSRDVQSAAATMARGHSEFKPVEVQIISTTTEDRPVRSTRSIRGGGGGGGKGKVRTSALLNSEPLSLLGSPSSTKRRWGDQGLDDSSTAKSSPSGGSSVGELVIGEGEVNRSPHGSMESSMSREDGSGKTKARQTELKENSTRESQSPTLLTHPFRLITAYPISKSDASAVTTYHHCAFETVDYIFFSPISCNSGKSVTGFNLLQRKVLPSTHTLLDLGPQPHHFLSSDHLLIQAMFQFSW